MEREREERESVEKETTGEDDVIALLIFLIYIVVNLIYNALIEMFEVLYQ